MIFTKNLPPNDYPHNFVVIWSWHGKLWSDTLRWVDGELLEYSTSLEEFVESSNHPFPKGACTYVLSI